MNYKNFIRSDISIKILSNYPFEMTEVEEDFEKFKMRLKDYDFGVWVDEKLRVESEELRVNELKIFNDKREILSWEDIVLNYLNFLNTFMREQIGVCIEKTIPRILDNELTYLIIQRKDYKDFDENFFIAYKGEVIFPMIKKEFDINLALIKLAEWKNRAKKELRKFT
ncbi:stationary phase survival protein SurE [Caminibacter sp.]